MKTKTILFILLLISGMMSAQVKRVAILETVDKENKIQYANKLILRANLSKAITNTAGYEAYDRTDIDAIMGEQNFQRTGMVSNDQIKRLGEMTGANYILVAEAAIADAKTMFITAKLLDVETARTILTDNVMMGTSPESIQAGCIELAKKLFNITSTTQPLNSVESTKPQTAQEINKNIVQKTQETSTPIRTSVVIENSKRTQKLLGVNKFSYGDVQMNEKELQAFLYKHSPQAYSDYKTGAKLTRIGWWMLGAGLVAIPAGITMGAPLGGGGGAALIISFSTIGAAVVAASVPVLCIGIRKKNRSYDLNNYASIPSNSRYSLSVQSSLNGVGLALNF